MKIINLHNKQEEYRLLNEQKVSISDISILHNVHQGTFFYHISCLHVLKRYQAIHKTGILVSPFSRPDRIN